MDDDDISTNLVLEEIETYFDTTGDGGISQEEFVTGMTKLALTLLDQTPSQIATSGQVPGSSESMSRHRNLYIYIHAIILNSKFADNQSRAGSAVR